MAKSRNRQEAAIKVLEYIQEKDASPGERKRGNIMSELREEFADSALKDVVGYLISGRYISRTHGRTKYTASSLSDATLSIEVAGKKHLKSLKAEVVNAKNNEVIKIDLETLRVIGIHPGILAQYNIRVEGDWAAKTQKLKPEDISKLRERVSGIEDKKLRKDILSGLDSLGKNRERK